jgi:thymidylate synthase
MNIFAFVMLARKVADRVEELTGKPLELGRYNHQADSYHVYGSNLAEFRDRFLANVEKRSFEDRTYRYDGAMGEMMAEAVPGIMEKVKTHDERD